MDWDHSDFLPFPSRKCSTTFLCRWPERTLNPATDCGVRVGNVAFHIDSIWKRARDCPPSVAAASTHLHDFKKKEFVGSEPQSCLAEDCKGYLPPTCCARSLSTVIIFCQPLIKRKTRPVFRIHFVKTPDQVSALRLCLLCVNGGSQKLMPCALLSISRSSRPPPQSLNKSVEKGPLREMLSHLTWLSSRGEFVFGSGVTGIWR